MTHSRILWLAETCYSPQKERRKGMTMWISGGFNRLGLLLKIARNLFEHLPDLGPHQSMMGPSSRID